MQRVTRRSAPTASERFHATPRSRPVFWLIGGIGACFVLILAGILLGGTAGDPNETERVNQLETKALRLSEKQPEEALRVYQELLELPLGDAWKVKRIEWRHAEKELKADLALTGEAKKRIAAWVKASEAATPATARDFLIEGERLKAGSGRLWTHDARLEKLRALIPKEPPSFAESLRGIVERFRLERRGEADWGGALREWSRILNGLPPLERGPVEDAMKTIGIKSRDEARSLIGRGLGAEDLKKHLARFEGTPGAEEIEKAIKSR